MLNFLCKIGYRHVTPEIICIAITPLIRIRRAALSNSIQQQVSGSKGLMTFLSPSRLTPKCSINLGKTASLCIS